MKLLLLGIIILFLVWGSKHENTFVENLKKKEGEYGGIFIINTQIKLLKDVKNQIKGIPSHTITPTEIIDINKNINIVINSLQNWLKRRSKYLNANNKKSSPPPDDASIIFLKKIWDDNGIGLKILIEDIIRRMDITIDSHRIVYESLNKFIETMNEELIIVKYDTIQTQLTDTNKNKPFEPKSETESDRISNITNWFSFGEEDEMPYEQRFS